MTDAVIVDAVRTGGKRNGKLATGMPSTSPPSH